MQERNWHKIAGAEKTEKENVAKDYRDEKCEKNICLKPCSF